MPSEFLYNLTKNLTAHLRHYLCAVLPQVIIVQSRESTSLNVKSDEKAVFVVMTIDFFGGFRGSLLNNCDDCTVIRHCIQKKSEKFYV